jgi:hypothetical protein
MMRCRRVKAPRTLRRIAGMSQAGQPTQADHFGSFSLAEWLADVH